MTFLKIISFFFICSYFSNVSACFVDPSIIKTPNALHSKADCDLALKIEQWRALETNPNTTFEDITDFFFKNPTWPNQVVLKRKAEEAINANTSKTKMLQWFRKNPPATAKGAIAFVTLFAPGIQKNSSFHSTQNDLKAIAHIFRKTTFSANDLSIFIQAAGHFLNHNDFMNRFDDLMKSDQLDAAEQMLSYLPQKYIVIAKERLKLGRASIKGAPKTSIKRLNTTLPGYLWQYALYLLKNERNNDLIQLLRENTVGSAEKLDPGLWWTTIRRVLTRRILDEKNYKIAYDVVSNAKISHSHPIPSNEYAEAKWLQGWINLRFLKRTTEALHDFQDLYDKADTALNLSKAAYWAARAATAHNDKKSTKLWLEKASKHRASFYGQLAHDMLQKPFKASDIIVTPAEEKAFEKLELVRVIRLLKKAGNIELSELFFWKLAINVSTPAEHELLIRLASQVAGPYAAVQVTKIGAKHIMPAIEEAYPHIDKAHMPAFSKESGVNIHALIHAIIRQESRFKATAQSHKGAKGLMQILDGTAHMISKDAGITFKNIYDPKSNIALGESYLKSFLKRFKGSLILTIAAYNAGPNRVDHWIKQYGFPGEKGGLEPIEWIQIIPYKETRHYVERVLENYWRYVVSLDGVPVKAWNKLLF